MSVDLLDRMDRLQAWDSLPREEKLAWGEGPWVDEPDKVQWVDTVTDLDCLAVRNPRFGNWCGYVGLPPTHRMYGLPYQEVDGADDQWLDVHGGLTFSDRCHETGDPSTGICHIPLPGRAADVWWLGFDCAHAMDLQPAFEHRMRELEAKAGITLGLSDLPPMPGFMDTYRDLAYVQAQVFHLAEQLA